MSPIVPRLTESTSVAAGSRAGPASDPVNGQPNQSRPSLRLLSGTSGADGPDAVGLEHPAGLNGGAIRVLVAEGRAVVRAGYHALLENAEQQHGLHTAQVSDQLEELTSREREVLVLVGKGLSNAEIGEALVISPRTAKTHVSRAMLKLGARHRAQLVVLAYESGLVQPRLGPLPRRGSMAATGAGRAGTEAREVGARRAE